MRAFFGLEDDTLPPGLDEDEAGLRDIVQRAGRRRFAELWPALLEEHHVTRSEVAGLVMREVKRGALRIEPDRPRRRAIWDDEWIVCDG